MCIIVYICVCGGGVFPRSKKGRYFMFDISYEPEASVIAAEILKERTWKKILNSDLLKPFGPVFLLRWDSDLYNQIINYWSIMYYTHGV